MRQYRYVCGDGRQPFGDLTLRKVEPECASGRLYFSYAYASTHGLDKVLDNKLLKLAKPALKDGVAVKHDLAISNRDRSAGTMLSGRIAKKFGHEGSHHAGREMNGLHLVDVHPGESLRVGSL